MSKKDNRYRSWAFIVYPESAPENWESIIDDRHIRWSCSPLHDRDYNPNGEKKKNHWHVVVDFDGKKSFEQIKEISNSVKACNPIPLDSLFGYVRYFTHMDNPEKAQYSQSDIRCFGGFEISDCLRPSVSKQYRYISEMTEYIYNNRVESFSKFADYCRKDHFDTWFPVLADKCAYFIGKLIDDIRVEYRK